ncbi:HAD-IIA family hydrolase [Mesorhizobium sp.]|uniref:HAD-IIA family hydrolase n=1 Tax=Mesorhizobium sp. TaxID=1871066 RepID=UPI000FE936B3|nr:HAD-IIA family hydrolase [Mesorhizobium sp.]RWI16596.1 MAG: HAD-IIA family hydrolase [Mesorhizobium sp.]RWN07664.1 MAG: HAD-IIA family hydrolase [Mesorhizobium sp.]RWN12417.1 MAG: HAD-IIA family hydrolase [Mesorhizobium sp.]TIQ97710.1 MAG: HAD-IIA family hydrolase [Mesorhizobium sp.]
MADFGAHQDWPRVEGIISDLDGVVYRGKAPIPDAVETFNLWRTRGLPFCFVTNNSTHTPEDVIRKLAGFGLAIEPRNVVTSAITAAELIRANYPQLSRVYVIGAPSLVAAITAVGLEVTDRSPEVVVMGLDRSITHDKLRIAVNAILGGAVFVGTNPDLLLPTEDGFEPGAGAILAAVAAATQRKPLIVGKPEVHMIETALARLGTSRNSTVMIGDQIATDIQAGKRASLRAVLVTTGVPSRRDSTLIAPDLTVASLSEINLENECSSSGRNGRQ